MLQIFLMRAATFSSGIYTYSYIRELYFSLDFILFRGARNDGLETFHVGVARIISKYIYNVLYLYI